MGSHTSEVLQSFVTTNLSADNAAVVGVGVPHDKLVAYAQSLTLKAGHAAPTEPSKLRGGEVRLDTKSPLTYVAVASGGASLIDIKNVIIFALIQRSLGAGMVDK